MTIVAAARAVLTTLPGEGPCFWLLRAAGGVLLGSAITVLDFAYYFPVVSAMRENSFLPFLSLLLVYCGECVMLALCVGLAEYWAKPRELHAWEFALALAAGVLFAVLMWRPLTLVLHDRLGIPSFLEYLGQPMSWGVQALYHGWLMLFFGGLIGAMYLAQRWRERMLAALRTAELTRASLQWRLAQVGLATLQLRIDPEYLSEELAKLERLYTTDPAAADRLLDDIVAFLRGALTDARTGDVSPGRCQQPA